ncbi:T9SS C-terminal target domain-containing protein, partial [Parabacteroides sp.]
DTFRMQTFQQQLSDNWKYTSDEPLSIVNVSALGIDGKSGKYALQLPLGKQASFEHYPFSIYKDIEITIHAGGKSLKAGENLLVKPYRPDDSSEYYTFITVKEEDKKTSFRATTVRKNPPGIDIKADNSASNTQNGYYYIDSVYAHGTIRAYSLFTGSSDWNDTTRWSHIPAYRHRYALINGEISVNSQIHCENILIGKGYIDISSTGSLFANNLTAYSNDNSPEYSSILRSSGDINITGSITIEKTFAQKGKWYFISFPFDVYASGIDPNFQLGDDTGNTNGNYFYLRTYNGAKRATQQSLSNNWEVIPKSIIKTNGPIFQKNKGYLIALDASADRQTLRFSSRPGDIPTDFGKNGQASVQVTINPQGKNQNHNGWYLCGNPLPAPLPLNQIESNSNLDGYIYIYDGSEYKPYPVSTDFAIPPFSAFFIKAKKNTSLSVQSTSASANYQILSTNQPLGSLKTEPLPMNGSTVSNDSPSFTEVRYYLNSNILCIENLTTPGKVEAFSPAGTLVFSQPLEKGSSTIQLPLPQGLYILIIQTEHYRAQYKCVLTS